MLDKAWPFLEEAPAVGIQHGQKPGWGVEQVQLPFPPLPMEQPGKMHLDEMQSAHRMPRSSDQMQVTEEFCQLWR